MMIKEDSKLSKGGEKSYFGGKGKRPSMEGKGSAGRGAEIHPATKNESSQGVF